MRADRSSIKRKAEMDQKGAILIVDDDASSCATLARILISKGYQTDTAATGHQALEKVEGQSFNVALVDIRLPDVDGTDLLGPFRERQPDMAVVLVTAYASIQSAVQALNQGAAAYIVKPMDMDGMLATVRQVLDRQRLVVENRRLYEEIQRELAERKRAQEALAREGNLLRTLMDSLPDSVFVKDRECRFIAANAAQLRLLGLQAQEQLIGRMDADFLPAETAEKRLVEDQYVIHSGQPILEQERVTDRKGSVRWLLVTKVPLRDSQGRIVGLVGVSRDVTQHKSLQDQLRQAEKIEAIGRLAGGIAHDFNNHLMVINNEARFILDDLDPDSPLHEGLAAICQAGESAAELTSKLMSLSRSERRETRVLNLNQVLEGMSTMLRRVIAEDVNLVMRLDQHVGKVRADPVEFERIVVNLAVNARDAMPTGGTLTLETANVELDEAGVKAFPVASPGPFVLLAITDTGSGMTPEVRERIFEPFFTTKKGGAGTGLGLATVYRVVSEAGGGIAVDTEPGQGTTFRIYWPRLEERQERRHPRSPAEALPQGSETVLVVDDEDYVRSLAVRMLRGLGYNVLAASTGPEAIQLCKTSDQRIDLLLTDVVMPGMNGREVVDALSSADPDLGVVYMTGYGLQIIGKAGLDPSHPLVQKPFTTEKLAATVREALDAVATE
ncbi:MAG: response regulator [Anaerolineales bacterium]|nr:MAG: response regulator [Anaerolineales bacterium]